MRLRRDEYCPVDRYYPVVAGTSPGRLNAVSLNTLRGRRDGAMLGLPLGCGLRRSKVVGLRLDQPQ